MLDSTTVAVGSGAQSIAPPSSKIKSERLRGVDSIRSVSALVVVLGHLGLFGPVTSAHSDVLRLASRISGVLWNGPAAVIVFFIVSGFCIHLPFQGGRNLNLSAFIARRFLRVGIPVLVATVFADYVLKDASGILAVTWSIVCEVIYYAIYPALRAAARRTSWNTLIGVSFVVSFVLGIANLRMLAQANNAYTALGGGLTWVIGLPCWLLGCKLAERFGEFEIPSTARLWIYRTGIIVLTVLLRIVKFHVHSPLASNCFTLNLFAFPAYFWVGSEIAYFREHRASALLEWMGTWSYSLYLVHPLCWGIINVCNMAWITGLIAGLHITVVLLAAALSYLFFVIIERPSHWLATKTSRALAHVHESRIRGV